MAKIRKKKSISKPKKTKISKREPTENKIKQYIHNDTKRSYNPPVGLVTPETDKDMPQKKYSYDPHLDPQLIWSGKAENTSFEVDTVSLHVHERIDPLTIIEKVFKKEKDGPVQQTLFEFFGQPENNPPLREAIEFYKHDQNWSNRLIAGDSLLVMNSLLQKEGMGGKVQMIYIDPPYGIKYGSNFQPFVNKLDVKDGKDEDLTQEPEMIKAFRDTWELGIHSYLTYLRDRLFLSKELLTESGSIFVQISDENVHLVRTILDEIFGDNNFVSQIVFKKASSATTTHLATTCDFLLWYTKNKGKMKYHQLYLMKIGKDASGFEAYRNLELPDGTRRPIIPEEIRTREFPEGARLFTLGALTSQSGGENSRFPVEFEGKTYILRKDYWKTNADGMTNLIKAGRIVALNTVLRYVRYIDDFPGYKLTQAWMDVLGAMNKTYVVETNPKVIERCLLMTTDPGDLVLDPTCGSGTTAYVAEEWGRRWITCDTSRVAIALTKQLIMSSVFNYYELAHPKEGISSGFKYKTVSHIMLSTIANDEPPKEETFYDQPIIDKTKIRISGPFTVEAVPSPVVHSMDTLTMTVSELDQSITRSGENSRQQEWRDELLNTGVQGKNGQKIEFSRVEPLPGTQWLHADAETKEKEPKRVVVSFGPEYAPLEQKQVAHAIEEAQKLVPKPKIIIFTSFQFDPEAAKDIDETNWPGVTLLKAHMNADLLTEDLKKKKTSNESFWLMGQPDVGLKKNKDGKYIVEVNGFDYYNTKTGEIESGDSSKIAMWMLDTDYDGRSLYPQQVFFPMTGESGGWNTLAKNLKAEIDEELIEKYRGTTSIPFSRGDNKQVAVKIIDDRGIESLRIIKIE